MPNPIKTVVITGANRGIGLATAQKFLAEGYFVIATSRSGVITINHTNLKVYKLDLTNADEIKAVARSIPYQHDGIDVLINNAGILIDLNDQTVDINKLRQTLEVNLYGHINFTQALLENVKPGAHIINISSSMGSLTEDIMDGYAPAYRISKAALNMYTKLLAKWVEDKNITVSAISPGWVSTAMGGEEAPRTPEEAATEIFNHSQQQVESGHFWQLGEKRVW